MDRPLRIAQVAPPLERVPPEGYGGTERVMYELIVELVRRGHDVTTFASGDSEVPGRHRPDRPRRPPPGGLQGRPDGVLPDDDARGARQRARLRHHPQPPGVVERALREGRERAGRRDVPRPARPAMVPGAPRLAVVGLARRDQPVPGVGASGHRLDGRPQRADLGGEPLERRRSDALCFVGRVAIEKGIVEAIDIARIADRPLRIAAKIAPTGAEHEYYEEVFVPALKAAGSSVEFLGEVSGAERDELLAESYAALMPGSWPEPFGLAAIEALACGTPVLPAGSAA